MKALVISGGGALGAWGGGVAEYLYKNGNTYDIIQTFHLLIYNMLEKNIYILVLQQIYHILYDNLYLPKYL